VSQEETSCDTINECSWYDYEKNRPKQLFSEEFCHPIKVDDLAAADWEQCINKNATMCPTATCAFTNGVEMIPKEDFCAPMYMTDDVNTILQCTDAKDIISCMPYLDKTNTNATLNAPSCMWRKAPVVSTNTKLDTVNKALFESNFCHPFNG